MFGRYYFMSMRVAHLGEDQVRTTYVAAPRRSDALGSTLRAAYAATVMDADPFSDMIAALDRIESIALSR